jgi:ketosteroid isomerase-like protein
MGFLPAASYRLAMDNTAIVERVVARILAQDLESGLDLFTDDVAFMVASPGRGSPCVYAVGREPVIHYFEALGGIVTFWQVSFFLEGERVLVLGRESYTMNAGLEAASDFGLVFDLRDGRITGLLVIEGLPARAETPTWTGLPPERELAIA